MKRLLAFALLVAPFARALEIKPDGSLELRVVSYNIRNGGRGLDDKWDTARTARVLAALKPDVVLLQEVDMKAKRSGNKDVAGEIAASLGMKSVFGKAMPYGGGGYGIAIRTALPLAGVREIRMDGGSEPRLVLGAFAAKDFGYATKTGAPETFPADKPKTEIDHFVWFPKAAFALRECRVVNEPVASDHRPLTLDVTLAPAK